jgi:signal transduction histidine kinase
MTPLEYNLLWAASQAIFVFGALAFSTLTLFYWRQRWERAQGGIAVSGVFPAFTLVCAAAFVLNLVRQADPKLEWLNPLLDLVTGLVPALLIHLVVEEEGSGPRWLPAAFYAGSAALAAAVAASDAGWSPPAALADRLESAPAAALGVAAIAGLALQAQSRRTLNAAERRLRWWTRLILFLLAASVAATSWPAGPLFSLVPDYLLLVLFSVTLYYKERLVFFDLLLKRGTFFAIGLIAFWIFYAYIGRPSFPDEVIFAGMWLAAPWIYSRLSTAIDHAWLRRRFTAPEAERLFMTAVQAAESQDDLRVRAAAALGRIFEARAEIGFHSVPQAGSADLAAEIGGDGGVTLAPRANGIPYLSDDRHLLQSLARTLGVVLENVRFREREQGLRLLAGRAELKALRAQINPHFLFNALNAIAGLIHTDSRAAEDTVEQLAEVFRYTLRKSENEWVRLDEEIEFVTAYLRVEQSRFGERLAVRIDVEPGAGATQVPAMCIQPLVENAIKHGTSAVEGVGRVSVRVAVAEGVLTVEVADNGPGFPEGFAIGRGAAGHGLRNVADRLSGYYGNAASLRAGSSGGARVWLAMPVNGARRDASPDRR